MSVTRYKTRDRLQKSGERIGFFVNAVIRMHFSRKNESSNNADELSVLFVRVSYQSEGLSEGPYEFSWSV